MGSGEVSRSEMRDFVQNQRKQGLARRRTGVRAQASPQFDADLSRLQSGDRAKGPFPDGNNLGSDVLHTFSTLHRLC